MANSAFTVAGSSGGVSSVATAGLATGGTITSTGTITVAAASQAQQQAFVSNVVAVTPANQQWHPSAAKFYLGASSLGTIVVSYNIAMVGDAGTGDIDVEIATDFTSQNYIIVGAGQKDATTSNFGWVTIDGAAGSGPTAGTFSAYFSYDSTTLIDPNYWMFSGFGTQV